MKHSEYLAKRQEIQNKALYRQNFVRLFGVSMTTLLSICAVVAMCDKKNDLACGLGATGCANILLAMLIYKMIDNIEKRKLERLEKIEVDPDIIYAESIIRLREFVEQENYIFSMVNGAEYATEQDKEDAFNKITSKYKFNPYTCVQIKRYIDANSKFNPSKDNVNEYKLFVRNLLISRARLARWEKAFAEQTAAMCKNATALEK